jgi:hypothetical protein
MFLDSSPRLRLGIRLLTGLMWLAVLASIAWWALQLMDGGKPVPLNARELGSEPPVLALNWPALAPRFGANAVTPVAQDVRVLGVVIQPGAARAVLSIEGNSKPAVVAAVNTELPDGSKVRSIDAETVTLLRNGSELKLPVPEVKDAKPAPASGAAPPPPPPPAFPAPPAPAPQAFNPARLNGVVNIGPAQAVSAAGNTQ